jgi:Holliday junction resolvase RusA-like endonuclease
MAVVDITIPGTPTAKGRPRFSRRSGRAFTPKKTQEAEDTLKQRAMALLMSQPGLPLRGPLRLEATFTSTVPKSWPKKKREAARAPTGRPDVDNLLKLATDALNGIVWVDDSQIVTIVCRKVYGDVPSTRLIVNHEGES